MKLYQLGSVEEIAAALMVVWSIHENDHLSESVAARMAGAELFSGGIAMMLMTVVTDVCKSGYGDVAPIMIGAIEANIDSAVDSIIKYAATEIGE